MRLSISLSGTVGLFVWVLIDRFSYLYMRVDMSARWSETTPTCVQAGPCCLPACRPACQPASLPPHLPFCLSACLSARLLDTVTPVFLPTCHPAYQPACLLSCWPDGLPAGLPASLPASEMLYLSPLRTCLPSCRTTSFGPKGDDVL